MSLKDILVKIEENQKKIAAYGKFDDEILKKINYKLRLDWNYYSNRMEGGTLTKAETRSVMVGNIDVKGKPFKDVAEMTGHDKIILEVLKMSKGELRIAEKRIKDIHKAIMYEEDSEKAAPIGQWKKDPNEIIGYKNEKISFTQPGDVAEEVHKLLDKTNSELDKFYSDKPSIHPIELAAQFHIDYVSIHPFFDGNGRTSRILTNILLMSCGYPTIVIKDEHKQVYYKLLGDIQAYGGKADLFYSFIAERVIDTQQLILDALEGKDIEEKDDIDKEIQLWKQNLANESLVVKKDNKLLAQAYRNSIRPLLELFISKNEHFDDLFAEKILTVQIENMSQSVKDLSYLDQFFQYFEIESDGDGNMYGESESRSPFHIIRDLNQIHFQIYLQGFKKNGINFFDERTELYFSFEEFAYKINESRNQDLLLKKLYSEGISPFERETIVRNKVKKLFENIKENVERMNNKL